MRIGENTLHNSGYYLHYSHIPECLNSSLKKKKETMRVRRILLVILMNELPNNQKSNKISAINGFLNFFCRDFQDEFLHLLAYPAKLRSILFFHFVPAQFSALW